MFTFDEKLREEIEDICREIIKLRKLREKLEIGSPEYRRICQMISRLKRKLRELLGTKIIPHWLISQIEKELEEKRELTYEDFKKYFKKMIEKIENKLKKFEWISLPILLQYFNDFISLYGFNELDLEKFENYLSKFIKEIGYIPMKEEIDEITNKNVKLINIKFLIRKLSRLG